MLQVNISWVLIWILGSLIRKRSPHSQRSHINYVAFKTEPCMEVAKQNTPIDWETALKSELCISLTWKSDTFWIYITELITSIEQTEVVTYKLNNNNNNIVECTMGGARYELRRATPKPIPRDMSFLSEIKRFDGKSLRPVDTNLTTADGKKVGLDSGPGTVLFLGPDHAISFSIDYNIPRRWSIIHESQGCI